MIRSTAVIGRGESGIQSLFIDANSESTPPANVGGCSVGDAKVSALTLAPNSEIAIVMGCHNGARHLLRTVNSIQQQDLGSWQFVIVDDGSTDQTPEILARLESEDGRIRVIRQERVGLTEALKIGCEATTANYIARQDVGDYSLPDRLSIQKAFSRST